MSQNTFSIEARSYDLGKVASHNFWVLRNNDGEVMSELHGLATDRKTNTFKPIGLFKDRLGFYELKRSESAPSFISKKQKSVIIFEGDEEEVLSQWNKAACQVERLNDQDLDYSPLGILGLPITNSNSAYHLFANLMDISCYRFSGVLEPGINNDLVALTGFQKR